MIWPSIEIITKKALLNINTRKQAILEFTAIYEDMPEEVKEGYKQEYRQLLILERTINKYLKDIQKI